MKNTMAKVGSWAFIVGVVIALVAGIFTLGTWSVTALVVVGLLVGFLNITEKETNGFLFAALVLVIIGSMGSSLLKDIAVVGPRLASVLAAVVIFVIPAALVVALKSIYALAKDQ